LRAKGICALRGAQTNIQALADILQTFSYKANALRADLPIFAFNIWE
jgi:hypothetical protein